MTNQQLALESFIESLEYDLNDFLNPPPYHNGSKYYDKCDTKAQLLGDIVSSLKKISKISN